MSTNKAIDVVKRTPKRKAEAFQRTKLHYSVKAACLSVRGPSGEADDVANKVCDAVLIWLEERPEITSNDLRRVAAKHLKRYRPDAAYSYENHHFTI